MTSLRKRHDDRTCPACATDSQPRILKKENYTYLVCAACGLGWLDPLPSAEQAKALYAAEYFTAGAHAGYSDYLADESLHRRNARRRLTLMARAGARPTGPLLDVGCAAGFFLDEARSVGWNVFGVDVSPWAADQARRRLGMNIFADAAEIPAHLRGSFSAVTMFQTLEHMVFPQESLRQAVTLLRGDGLLFIETWDRASWIARMMGSNWQQVSPPSVLWLFTEASLAALLQSAGLRLVAWQRTSKEVSASFVAQLLAQKHGILRRPLVPFMGSSRLGRLSFAYKLGDLVTVVAEPA
jgi:SAM-dependent methyltransferase